MAGAAAYAIGAGLATQAIGQQQAATAQGRAAEAQLSAARRERKEDMAILAADRELAMKYAQASPQELAQIDQSIRVNEADIKRKEQLIASVDPALMEAGKQALELLQGKEASVLAPLRNQREQQRKALEDNLRASLGSGYATSSAGAQALARFDQQTAETVASAQQQTLSQLLGTAQYVGVSTQLGQNVANSSAIASQLADIFGGRQIKAMGATPLITNRTTVPYEGAPFVQAAQQGAGLASTGSLLTTLGAMGMMYGGGNAAATPATAGTTAMNYKYNPNVGIA